MNITRSVIMISLFLTLVFIIGCGRKTAPVFSEKDSVSTAEEGKNKE